MVTLLDLDQGEGILILLTLLLQVSVLMSGALLVSYRYKRNASIRYGITFSTLLFVAAISATSLSIQYTGKSVISIPLISEQWLRKSLPSQTPFLSENPVQGLDNSIRTGLDPNQVAATGLDSYSTISNTDTGMLSRISLFQVLVIVWLSGVLLSFFDLLFCLRNVHRIRNNSRCLERNDLEHIKCIFGREKIAEHNVQFRESSTISSPVVTGLFSPIVLLPSKFLWKLNNAQLSAILLHELAHIERKDTQANLVQKLIIALFWFHPLAHVLDRQISRSREEICDNYVLAQQSALEYGEALFHASLATTTIRGKVSLTTGALGIFNGNWELEKRIRELIDVDRDKATDLEIQDRARILLSVGLLSLVLSFSQISTAQSNNLTEKQTIPLIVRQSEFRHPNINPNSLIRVHFIPNSQRTLAQEDSEY